MHTHENMFGEKSVYSSIKYTGRYFLNDVEWELKYLKDIKAVGKGFLGASLG